jgi:hypothetical protein
MQITASVATPQVPQKSKNTDWKLEDDPKFGDAKLHSPMRIRSDSNQFTDIEIYALGLLRLQQRCVRFAARELKQEAVGDREALERPNAQIVWTGS